MLAGRDNHLPINAASHAGLPDEVQMRGTVTPRAYIVLYSLPDLRLTRIPRLALSPWPADGDDDGHLVTSRPSKPGDGLWLNPACISNVTSSCVLKRLEAVSMFKPQA